MLVLAIVSGGARVLMENTKPAQRCVTQDLVMFPAPINVQHDLGPSGGNRIVGTDSATDGKETAKDAGLRLPFYLQFSL